MNVAPLTPGASSAGLTAGTAGAPGGGQAFGALVDQLLAGQAQAGKSADQAVQALATGQADNLHAVSLAVAQADLSFRLILELRNRVTEAYQDVMRMQV
jgi:flagellar hook-basal body complex protein FliE